LLGSNGTGKTTFGDVLVRLQWLLFGRGKTDDIFTADTLTRWQHSPLQRFAIDATSGEGNYRYELTVEHRGEASADAPRTRIRRESLTFQSGPLFLFEDGVVHLFRDDYSKGAEYPFDWGRSALGSVFLGKDNLKLSWFVRWLQALTVLKPNPPAMGDMVEGQHFVLAHDASNFAAWYHSVSAADKRTDRRLHDTLAEVLPGFDALNFEPAGPNRWMLRTDFARAGERLMLRFSELSDGQKELILLYSVLHFLLEAGQTVLLDEPDNFVALSEIQPWLLSAADAVDGGTGQLIVISHHPEIFNQWAVSHGLVTEREECGPVRVLPFSPPAGTGLSTAELISRGWSNGVDVGLPRVVHE
jgi:hypothetical protein